MPGARRNLARDEAEGRGHRAGIQAGGGDLTASVPEGQTKIARRFNTGQPV